MSKSLVGDRVMNALVALAIVAFLTTIAAGGAWTAATAASDAANSSENAAESAERVAQKGLDEVLQGQQNGNATRALLCQTILYDNDRLEAGAPVQDSPCRWPEVIVLYPPEVCAVAANLGAPLLCEPLPD